MKITDEFIWATWDTIESTEPDISTERLIAMTVDCCNCSYDDVIGAMSRHPETVFPDEKEAQPK